MQSSTIGKEIFKAMLQRNNLMGVDTNNVATAFIAENMMVI